MATPPPLPEKVTKEPNSEMPPQATPFAWTGTCQGHAAPTHTFPDTGAPAAGTVTTEPKTCRLCAAQNLVLEPLITQTNGTLH
jgi:hypothetical protein